MRRILSQILFAVLTAALLLCGYFAAPLLGVRFAVPSLSGEKETGATQTSSVPPRCSKVS